VAAITGRRENSASIHEPEFGDPSLAAENPLGTTAVEPIQSIDAAASMICMNAWKWHFSVQTRNAREV